MPDPRLTKWADVLVNYSTGVRAGDTVAIMGGVAAADLMVAIGRAVLRLCSHPAGGPERPPGAW